MAAAERDLLFGLIALQNGLIEPDLRIAEFHAWSRDKVCSIASPSLRVGVAAGAAIVPRLAERSLNGTMVIAIIPLRGSYGAGL